ncbi:MAG: glycosyltransferase [Bacteroidetes bacterium]|nr:glycosyltransferase [Bacteroidota bacterium]
MLLTLQIIYWACVLLLLHSYVLYPLLLRVFASGQKDNEVIYSRGEQLPRVFILMSAYNEQKVIREKLDSVLDTSYPLDRLAFCIGSDNSSDTTNEIISSYAAKYPQIRFTPYYERNGKSGVLNKLYTQLKAQGIEDSDVFILTDANVFFTRDCIYEMVKHFKNPSIGQVGGNVLNNGQRGDGISVQEATYIQRENMIKYREGLAWGAMMGAFGACYAMRADCFSPIPPNFLMEDFYISMSILQQGKKAISEFKAVCYEDVSNEVTEEFKRKTRISTGNWQNLGVYWQMLFRLDAVAFALLSHKVLRWMGPFIILLMLAASGILMLSMPLYGVLFVGLVLFCLSPIAETLLKRLGIHIALLRFIAYFNLMNLALLYGFYKYLTGVQTSAWSPTKRNV